MASNLLTRIVDDVRRRRASESEARADRIAAATPDAGRRARFVEALAGSGLAVIAECKRRSPSAGAIAAGASIAERARAYAHGGAAALSVLTEVDHFGGAPADLEAAGEAGLPRLRKDFLLELDDVRESAAIGADAVLLIAAILDDRALAELRAEADRLGLATLIEVHDEREFGRALAVEPDCLGVNARDLSTFEVDLGAVERLLPAVPAGIVSVAESGVRGPAELERVRAAGADAVLIGEALMRADDPAATLRSWKGVLRG